MSILRLQLPTDPRWANKVEENLEDILSRPENQPDYKQE